MIYFLSQTSHLKQLYCLKLMKQSYANRQKNKNLNNKSATKKGSQKFMQHDLFTHLEALDSFDAEQKKNEVDRMGVEFYQVGQNPEDNVSLLLDRAKGLTQANQGLIIKTRKNLKISEQQAANTFLTGTGIYTEQSQFPSQEQQIDGELDHNEMLKYLLDREKNNDLEELRRMMKITRKNLNSYTQELHETKDQVINAADKFHNQMDFRLSYAINKINMPPRKIQSSSMYRKK